MKTVREFIGLMIAANSANYLYTGKDMYGGAFNYAMLNNALTNGGVSGTCGSMGSSGTADMGATGMCPGMVGTIGMGAYDMGAALQVTLLTLSSKGNVVSDDIPTVVNPEAKRLSMDLTSLPRRTITFGMDMGNGYMNGQDYDIDPMTIASKEGDFEVWHIVNQTGMDHPFHMHTNSFQVLTITGGNLDYAWLYTTAPAMKDVVIVPKMGSVTLLVPVKDFTGMTMFHCHIVEHSDIGMMGEWEISGGGESAAGAGNIGSMQ
jgi:FtsP/CotA-like multicopper oxidase with cupredoxin domain